MCKGIRSTNQKTYAPLHIIPNTEDEYDMNSFRLASDDDLKELCPAKGPRLLLKSCRDKGEVSAC